MRKQPVVFAQPKSSSILRRHFCHPGLSPDLPLARRRSHPAERLDAPEAARAETRSDSRGRHATRRQRRERSVIAPRAAVRNDRRDNSAFRGKGGISPTGELPKRAEIQNERMREYPQLRCFSLRQRHLRGVHQISDQVSLLLHREGFDQSFRHHRLHEFLTSDDVGLLYGHLVRHALQRECPRG